ncbi:MAG TPA: hypothetical protein PKE07_08060 [Lacibacter sp.]|nr:hypothetical protein [Lacibacter sp.]HMO89860.1 hypothetical protein [Lacibacter sp.]
MKEIFQIVDADKNSTQASFRNIATQLMNNYKLQVADKFYRVIECEFYYHSSNHPDPYVHGHSRQKETIGEWYFHGSGLDITLSTSNGYGGILIRGIAEVNKDSIIPVKENAVIGPLNVCTAIFASIGTVLADKYIEFGFHDISKDPQGALMKTARVFQVPRIGLNASKDNDEAFVERPYRFISFLHLPHRETERIKTFLTTGENKQLDIEQYNSLKNPKDI